MDFFEGVINVLAFWGAVAIVVALV